MAVEKPFKKLEIIWHIISSQKRLGSVGVNEVKDLAQQQGLNVQSIEEIRFDLTPFSNAIYLVTDQGTALLPRTRVGELEFFNKGKEPVKNSEDFWEKIDWFHPVFMSDNKIYSALNQAGIDVKNHSNYDKGVLQSRFDTCLSTLYDFSVIIPITEQTLANSEVIGKHIPIIRESIFAFYSGMKIVAISSLIPIVEEIITSIIIDDVSERSIPEKIHICFNKALNRIISGETKNANWLPDEYTKVPFLKVVNERIRILESMRNWLIKSFYVKTDSYKNTSGFNRHIFAHAKSNLWQNPMNFFRAIGLIQALAFVECFALEKSKISIIPPTPNERSEFLRQEVLACINLQAVKQELLSRLQIANRLPFNPTASDDGWLLRASILSNKMNNEVIPRLREKGWDCYEFSDPIKEGEYITVQAKRDSQEIKVALLYSCASSNVLYKKLDESCNYILYQGAYYKQDEYAMGVNATIRPLNAWLAP